MTRAFLSGLSIEIPAGWEDQSMVTLVGPPLESAKLLRAKAETQYRPSIVMKREAIVGRAPSLETFAEAQATMMDKLMPGTKVDAKGELAIGEGIIAMTREYLIPTPSGDLRQLQVYFFIEDSFYVLAATAPNDMRFEDARREFLRAASGIRVEPLSY